MTDEIERFVKMSYYIAGISEDGCCPTPGMTHFIQITNGSEQPNDPIYICSSNIEQVAEIHKIPSNVLEIALSMPKGVGKYINESGAEVLPF